ncbi:protein FAM178B isoform X5 [Ictidomys tridecemlineatus]|uniref:protein FAM178B isoform X5 n=1 Tax=Ictidomys tridecemlineatus TaxID=43179 RepID=UPI001A9CC835|nr:protein FAM178B isoform X5 [Ictidomys tridecemlineatus]
MARPQKTVLALPWREGVQAATVMPIFLPNLNHSFLDHPLGQGLLRPSRRLCSPTLAPTPKSPKKPKMQTSGDMFPTDWSPPPVEFLNPRLLQTHRDTPGQRWVGASGPQNLRRLPKELAQDPLGFDPKEGLGSLEELFWNMAGPSQQAVTPETDVHASFASGGSERYVNSLDYLLQEKREQAWEQEREKLLLQHHPDFTSDLREDEVPLTPEHRCQAGASCRMLVERFSVSLQVIPPVHPGETVFLPRRHPLPCILDSSHLKPHNHLEELFLSSPVAQQLSFLHNGLLSNLYLHTSDCPVPLLQWLFQLLTWPPETSSRAFALLWDLSVDGLFCQSDEDMRLWYPSLQEVMEAFHSLGAHNPALYPLGPFQHGSRLLESEASLSWLEQQDPPQEVALDLSLSYIYKFLTLCALAQPGAYTDAHLLGLIELLCRASLDVGLRLMPKTDLQQLLLLLLENIREWPGKLQPLCCALSWVSDHHHNLLALVQFFLDVTSRGRQLRSQLSLVVIARMLGQEELPLWQEKMQVCYMCHSLLTLAGVVVSSQDITSDQWGELQLLCMQLDRHISTHIRESPQAMHRTKLKDLATQTYIRWQELLAHCQPQVVPAPAPRPGMGGKWSDWAGQS